jgi:hypothetical protein
MYVCARARAHTRPIIEHYTFSDKHMEEEQQDAHFFINELIQFFFAFDVF